MKAIFLGNNVRKIEEIYNKQEVNKFLKELLPIEIYSKDDIIKNSVKFQNVEYIFSTWYMPKFSENEIKTFFPSLKALFYAAGSVKYFVEPFLKVGVKVFSAATANGIPVAEFVVSQIILANKGCFQAQRVCALPFFKFSYSIAYKYASEKPGNYRSKIGIIGFGEIGKKVVKLLQQFDLDINVVDPYVSNLEIEAYGAQKIKLEEMFEICDVISNHLPDIEETKGILNYSLFSKMKPYSTFINTGRGAQVIEKDLIRALKEKKSRCALLDVTSHEPLWPWSRLNWMKNVFITPHIAGSISEEERRMAEYMYEAYIDYVNDRHNNCEITFSKLSKMA